MLTGSQWACRLPHGAPSRAEAIRIAYNCPNLRALDATGCAQVLPESLEAFAHIPFQVGVAPPTVYRLSKHSQVCLWSGAACAVAQQTVAMLATGASVVADAVVS